MFLSSNTDDFASFSTPSSPRSQRRGPSHRKHNVPLDISGKTLTIIGIAAAAVLILVLLFSLIASTSSGGIEYEDNAFASYKLTDGSYRVSMNGKELRNTFESGVELIPAKDNSFAYVCADVNGAKNVYVLENSRLKLICEGVDEVLAYADLAPALVYKLGDRIEYYYDKTLTSLSRNNDNPPSGFVLAPDGTAIAYTVKNKNDPTINDLYVYSTDLSGPEPRSIGSASTFPVSVSNDAKYIVAYTEVGETRELYLIKGTERLRISGVDGAFDALTYKNEDASEILFTTKVSGEYRSYIYDCKEIKKDVTVAYHVSNGYTVPQFVDDKICFPETLKRCYYQDVTTSLSIYVNKKGDVTKISDCLGKIDNEGKHLYIIREGQLIQIELLGERFGKDQNEAKRIITDVKDFAITEKGNIYYTDGYGDLYFYKMINANPKPQRITNDVTQLTFYTYSNDLYFEKADSVEANGIYVTSEGSDYKKVEFGKVALTDSPVLTNAYSNKSYACYTDIVSGNYILFYTSNGRSFKQVAECAEILGDYKTDIAKKVADVLS